MQSVVGFARLTERQVAGVPGQRGMARQGRRLCDPGPRRGVRPLPVGQLLQCGRAAAVRDGTIAARTGLAVAMTTRILAACSPGEVRVAVVRDEHADGLRDMATGGA